MRNVVKQLWADPVWSKVIAGGITALVVGIVGTMTPLASEGMAGLVAAWHFLGRATPTPNWLLAILILIALIAVCVVGLALIRELLSAGTQTAAPSFTDYNMDVFSGILWRWRYYDSRPIDLAPFCPHCDFQIAPQMDMAFSGMDRLFFRCDQCGRCNQTLDMSHQETESWIIRQIQQRLRNGTWRDRIRARP